MNTAVSPVKPPCLRPTIGNEPLPLYWVVDACFKVGLVKRDGANCQMLIDRNGGSYAYANSLAENNAQ